MVKPCDVAKCYPVGFQAGFTSAQPLGLHDQWFTNCDKRPRFNCFMWRVVNICIRFKNRSAGLKLHLFVPLSFCASFSQSSQLLPSRSDGTLSGLTHFCYTWPSLSLCVSLTICFECWWIAGSKKGQSSSTILQTRQIWRWKAEEEGTHIAPTYLPFYCYCFYYFQVLKILVFFLWKKNGGFTNWYSW